MGQVVIDNVYFFHNHSQYYIYFLILVFRSIHMGSILFSAKLNHCLWTIWVWLQRMNTGSRNKFCEVCITNKIKHFHRRIPINAYGYTKSGFYCVLGSIERRNLILLNTLITHKKLPELHQQASLKQDS